MARRGAWRNRLLRAAKIARLCSIVIAVYWLLMVVTTAKPACVSMVIIVINMHTV